MIDMPYFTANNLLVFLYGATFGVFVITIVVAYADHRYLKTLEGLERRRAQAHACPEEVDKPADEEDIKYQEAKIKATTDPVLKRKYEKQLALMKDAILVYRM